MLVKFWGLNQTPAIVEVIDVDNGTKIFVFVLFTIDKLAMKEIVYIPIDLF